MSMPTLYYYDNNEHTTGKITGNLYFEYNQFDRSPNDATYWGGVLAEYMKDNAGAISKVGEAVILLPKGDRWSGFLRSFEMFSDDFMRGGREQPALQERESL